MNLYEYQLDAVRKLRNGCVLCGGVGSGKSLTAIAYYYLQNGGYEKFLMGGEYKPMHDPPKDLYIITTARKRDTHEWDSELTPFILAVGKDILKYHHLVVVDSWNNIGKYVGVTGAFFIFDEQRVVGRGAWVKNFLKISKCNDWILLSATPGDTWSDYVPLFIANGFVRNRTQFEREYVIFSQRTTFPKIERYIGENRLRSFRDAILVDMNFSRPTVSHHEDIYVQYDKHAYRELIRTRFNPWDNEPMENAAAMCYCLRRVVNSDETRQKAVLEIADKHPKVIIFYSFDYELDILKSLWWTSGTEIAEWNGHKHEPIPKSNRWVYLVNYAAGSEGWNCTSTDTIIFYSQHYSYKTLVQASGRIDRVNTPFRDLYFYHIKSTSGIDIAISRALRDKRTFNENRFILW